MRRLWLWSGLVGLLAAGPGWGADPTPKKDDKKDPVAALADRIDQLIQAEWNAKKVTPGGATSDAEFCRRIYLDLAGRIPRVSEVHAFLDSTSPTKRRELVEKLLGTAQYVNHFTTFWRTQLLPQSNDQQVQFLAPQLEQWVKVRVTENTPYDKFVRDLMTAPISFNRGRGVPANPQDAGVAAFYQANENKAENIAAATSRLFLGVKLECAQCHDHPFGKWTRTQFWEYAAFFSGIRPQQPMAGVFSPATEDMGKREIKIPGSDKTAQAKFLDGKKPEWKEDSNSRDVLADWVISGDNPYFARAIANKLWAQFMGTGLVDPVDDFNDDNPASHPELLDELAKALVKEKFDLKFLIRSITASKTYQLSSRVTHESQLDPRLFGRASLRGLTGEQLFDSIALATGYREDPGQRQQRGFNGFGGTPRADFINRFSNAQDKSTEQSTSILQALTLMNGKFVNDATSIERSQTLGAVVDAPFMTTRGKLDALFMAALSRPMSESEAFKLTKYVDKGGPTGDQKKALSDVFWAILNGSEFILNH